MKYYAVTKGAHSDYHIITITADKEKAELIAKLHTTCYDDIGTAARVEEYEESIELLLPIYEIQYSCDKQKISDISALDTSEIEPACGDGDFHYCGDDEKLNYVDEFESLGNIIFYVFVRARGEKAAEKIAQDLIAEYKAKKAGIV